MSLQVKDNQRAMWDAVNEFKVPPHLSRAPMSQTDRYGQKNPQSLKTSCFPQMLPTDDSCWASSNLSGRKASFCFTADRAHNSVQADGPGILLQRREAKETHKEEQFTVWSRRLPLHREKTSQSNQITFTHQFVDEVAAPGWLWMFVRYLCTKVTKTNKTLKTETQKTFSFYQFQTTVKLT